MNLYQLYYFRTLAKLEHYTKAAEELSMTQPSLSNAISTLESELEVRLFEKHGRNIKLTKYGKMFLPYVENSIKELEAGAKKMNEVRSHSEGLISLGYIYTLSSYFIPNLINSYMQEYPNKDIKFAFEEGRTREFCSASLVKDLKDEKCDLIFISLIPSDPEVEFICIGEQNLVALLPNDCPLARHETIDLKDIAPYSLIQYTGRIGLKREIESLFKEINMIPKVQCEVADDLSMAGLVAANVGIAIVPDNPAFRNYNITVRPISNPSYKRKIYLGYMKHRFVSESVLSFKDYVIKTLNESNTPNSIELGLTNINHNQQNEKQLVHS
ncbi:MULTISPECIES: LysR family transcriptional regulator [Bacillus]|uniref:LysR family transcriptional regulator n=1 Tax=Bacillus TaxID=1386 RepID=UPI0002F8D3FD|nr:MULTISPECIES: LysR family transcriptional regulator [Bacillus]